MRGGSCAILDWVARLLACGGLSDACRRPSSFSLLAQREVAKRNGLWSPPTLQALAVEVVWNRSDTSCSTDGHTAPSPFTEGGAGVPWIVVSLPGGRFNSAFSISAYAVMSRPAFAFARHPGAGRDPVAGAVGFRDHRVLASLDPGLRRDDGEGSGRSGK